jgi:hypothetical protein
MTDNPAEPRFWSFWSWINDWRVIAPVASFIYGVGMVALTFDEYEAAAILFLLAIGWATAKAASAHSATRFVTLGSFLCCVSFYWVQLRIDKNHAVATAPVQPPIQAPLLTWLNPAPIEAGTPLSENQLNATASFGGRSVKGRFVYVPAAGVKLPVGISTLTVTFSPSEPDRYASQTGAVAIEVKPKGPRKRTKPLLTIEFIGYAGAPGWEVVAINKTDGPVDNVSVAIARSPSLAQGKEPMLKALRERIVIPEVQTILGHSLKHLRELPPTLNPFPDKPSLYQIDFTTRYENFIEYLYITPRPDGGFDEAIDMGSLKSQEYFMHDAGKAERAWKNWPEWWR